jgi:hypothetical protein
MGSMSHARGWWGCVFFLCGLVICSLAVALAASEPAAAQTTGSTAVSLVLQDFSDCTNANVSDDNKILTRGTLFVVRNPDATTSVKIAMTVQRNTTYHFFLKCVRQLGDIKTDDEGIGEALFTFPTNSAGAVFAFDMYPEGAPAGDKYQSVQVSIQ